MSRSYYPSMSERKQMVQELQKRTMTDVFKWTVYDGVYRGKKGYSFEGLLGHRYAMTIYGYDGYEYTITHPLRKLGLDRVETMATDSEAFKEITTQWIRGGKACRKINGSTDG